MKQIHLRLVTMEDAPLVFRWRNDPFIVARGTSAKTVAWEEHLDWFKQTVEVTQRLMFIVQLEETPIGQVRFERTERLHCIISIYFAPEFVGKGYGISAIRSGCMEMFKRWRIPAVIACVRCDNAPGRRAFLKAGFQERAIGEQCDANHFELIYHVDAEEWRAMI